MTFFVIFWTYSLHIGNRLPYKKSAGDALIFLDRVHSLLSIENEVA
jgi:hypothetical protein